ncbi:hypothetical protein L861_15770 [Litchfieldella anticariensis FP35 = DSM 16096]|uniref:Uncharacterized protein n=1 Tax=Litchfieldella anticariensis (strain DSM 16096 / CECT 5854 / CIP 108499 / LMG 22089 / FP35) TaxID=1121939 RepID=S2LBQ5_LITA3|nr:hypothetical protein [Halomonas anticariensis]EPC02166.1 hypothetical protein L861_15770 [Halomonas anticariensis FP35 = DSM 16096]
MNANASVERLDEIPLSVHPDLHLRTRTPGRTGPTLLMTAGVGSRHLPWKQANQNNETQNNET